MASPFEVKLELRKEVNKMTDKKKKKSGPTISGGYKVSGGKVPGKDIAAQAIADIKAGYNFVGDNWNVRPYVSGSASKGSKGKLRTSVDRAGVEGEIRPSDNTSVKAGASMGRGGEDKRGRIEATYYHNWLGGKKGGLVKKKKRSMKKGGTVKKCRMDGIALRGKTRAKERSK